MNVGGILAALGAATAFSLFQVANGRALTRLDVARGTRWLLLTGAVVLGLGTVATEGLAPWRSAPPLALAAAAGAGLLHFLLGWTLLGTAQQRIGVARTGALVGAVPLFGALLAWAKLGEALTAVQLVGLLAVVAGVGIIATGRASGDAPDAGRTAGTLAALGTALCWATSPVLIRIALEGVGSPAAAATIGLLAGALVSMARGALLGAIARPAGTGAVVPGAVATPRGRGPIGLVVLAGVLVASALWCQWTALDLLPVAPVLVLLQLTPVLVPLLARLSPTGPAGPALARLLPGLVAVVGGSTTVILAG